MKSKRHNLNRNTPRSAFSMSENEVDMPVEISSSAIPSQPFNGTRKGGGRKRKALGELNGNVDTTTTTKTVVTATTTRSLRSRTMTGRQREMDVQAVNEEGSDGNNTKIPGDNNEQSVDIHSVQPVSSTDNEQSVNAETLQPVPPAPAPSSELETSTALPADPVIPALPADPAIPPLPVDPVIEANDLDIDTIDIGNQFALAEYAPEVYNYLRDAEQGGAITPNYMIAQPDINERMRSILNDWLVEVHLKFKLRPESLFLCFQLIDRFLQGNVINRQRLQLVGVTAMMLACKYEEIYPPELRDFVYICDNAYTREQILDMEATMLTRLSFRLSFPTPWSFMQRFCKAAGREGDRAFLSLVSCLVELAQIDYQMLRFLPSLLAASAVAVANKVLGEALVWTPRLQHHCRYAEPELRACMADLSTLILHAPEETRCRAVHRKYSHPRFFEVALLNMAALLPPPPPPPAGPDGAGPGEAN